MKRLVTLLLAAGLVFSAASGAQAIEFKASGQWLMGFSAGNGNFLDKTREHGQASQKADNNDVFTAAQRVRLQLDAVASENLSGTVYFEIGDTTWGHSGSGGALGADGQIVEIKRAYIDWAVPNTELKVRMGLQGMAMPNAAGGSAILDDDVAGVVASYRVNDNVGVTLSWARPYNDNYTAVNGDVSDNNKNNYLDNMDLISLAVPLTFEGIEVTPWAMIGIIGQNTFRNNPNSRAWYTISGYEQSYDSENELYVGNGRWNTTDNFKRRHANSTAFWAGLPVKLTLWDPLNIEFDINYGYLQSMGRGDMMDSYGNTKRYSTEREGWLAKALVEYKMDWGTPGIFGWYASGDDSNPGNGSERMPSVSPCGNFTSFMGDGNYGWSTTGNLYDRSLSYAGTWGVGLQVRDMSFIEDLKHTFRVAYWGGTNSPNMAKYANNSWGWGSSYEADYSDAEMYLTTNDGLLEFNLVNAYQMYENFEVNLELGYIVNFIDQDTWDRSQGGRLGDSYKKQDAWKAQLIFAYSF